MKRRSRFALAAGTAALVAVAAAPAAGQASTGPPPACFESPQFAICTSDVGPLVGQTLSDPSKTAAEAVAIAENVVCYGNDVCSLISTG